jgi:4-hydroxy-3-methylbut-2-enyl diphosphate reductase
MQIKLANPRGFCAGVDRAIDIVDRALEMFGAPVYVRHEVVHNKFVVNRLREKGAIFVEELHEVPDDKIVIFSAHGVSKSVEQEAQKRQLKVFDATCPLVTKVHMQVLNASKKSDECVLIGHEGHPEVEGTMGRFQSEGKNKIYLVESVQDVQSLKVNYPERLHYFTQTTLSVDDTLEIIEALREKFPTIQGPRRDDICYATQNRQDAVKQLAMECDLVLVVGSVNSSNSTRLKELAERIGCESYLIDGAKDISPEWLTEKRTIGITAGASAPETLVQEVINFLKEQGGELYGELEGVEENMIFALPKELR